MDCPACAYANNPESAVTCNLCGGILRPTTSITAKPAAAPAAPVPGGVSQAKSLPPALAAEAQAKEARQRELHERLRQHRLRWHMITGAMAFFLIHLLLGLPLSLFPMDLLWNLVFSAIFGPPVGFLISKAGGGMVKGGLISAGFFAAYYFVMLLILAGTVSASGSIVMGLLVGLLPGIALGWHVRQDNGAV